MSETDSSVSVQINCPDCGARNDVEAAAHEGVCVHCREELEHDVTISAPKVRGMLGAMAETDAEYIRLTPLGGKLRVEGVKSGGHVHHRWFVSAPGLREADYEYYSSDYLAKIARSLWPDGDVRVQFGAGQPLSLTNGALQFVQAPRIEPEFEEEA